MLSKRAKYALKTLLFLARSSGLRPVPSAEIADREQIPHKYLETILLDLKNLQILKCKSGKNGGYYLNRPPESIHVGNLIRVFNGPLAMVPCASQSATQRCGECPGEGVCPIRLIMREVRDATARILDGATLRGLLDSADQVALEAQASMYYI